MKRIRLFSIVAFVVLLAVAALSCNDGGDVVPAQVEPVTFAVLGNAGYATDGCRIYTELARTAIGAGADFIVDVGNRLPPGAGESDLDRLWAASDSLRAGLDIPVFPVAGRTDIFDYMSDITYAGYAGPQWYSFKRTGVFCIVLNTEDEAYTEACGTRARIGLEQLAWLERALGKASGGPILVFMHRPLWVDNPMLWTTTIRPLLKEAGVDCIVTAYEGGLFDWGEVDGIRAVSAGCSGPVEETGLGLTPHALLVTAGGKEPEFAVIESDGAIHPGIGIDAARVEALETITDKLHRRPLIADPSWNISDTSRIEIANPFDAVISGTLRWDVFDGTSWDIEPGEIVFSVEPGETGSFQTVIRATSPELGPVPVFHAELLLGGRTVFTADERFSVRIPLPRTDEPVSINAEIADVLPYAYDGRKLRIPAQIDGVDVCGRCVLYRDDGDGALECIYISPLRDFKPGINEFVWNGRDMRGRVVSSDTLSCHLFAYNKKAPATWVAEGPPNPDGTSVVHETRTGLVYETHDTDSVRRYHIGNSKTEPVSEAFMSFESLLDGEDVAGYVTGAGDRTYVLTRHGVLCVRNLHGGCFPDAAFGDDGYYRLSASRIRSLGGIDISGNVVYVGIGGDARHAPGILVLDAVTGELLDTFDLDGYFNGHAAPPSFAVAPFGLVVAHPASDRVIGLTPYGDLLWKGDEASRAFGLDGDGMSYTYGIGITQHGFSFVNTPGYSARSMVVGPDGAGLFRVILVSLPGLRVGDIVPSVTGSPMDGLYFVTRGGDKPYVFHIPFTIRTGLIVDESFYIGSGQ